MKPLQLGIALILIILFSTAASPKSPPATQPSNGWRWLVEPQFSDADTFSNGMARVYKNGNSGCIDRSGKFIIKPVLKGIWDKVDGYMKISKSPQIIGKEGLMDSTGKIVIPPKYLLLEDDYSHDIALVIGYNGFGGLIYKTGEVLLKTQYDDISDIQGDLIRVRRRQTDPYIILNRKGDTVIKTPYEDIFEFSHGLAIFVQNDKAGIIDSADNIVITPRFDQIGILNMDCPAITVIVDDKYGFVDKKGNYIIEPTLDHAEPMLHYGNGWHDKIWFSMIQKRSKFGIFNAKTATIVCEPKFDRIQTIDHSGDFLLTTLNDTVELITSEGNVIRTINYDKVKHFAPGLLSFSTNGLWGVVDKTGNVVIEPKYDDIHAIVNCNFAITTKGDKKGVIAKKNLVVIEPQFDKAYTDFASTTGQLIVVLDSKKGVVNINGKIILAPIYDYINNLSEGLVSAKVGQKSTVVDIEGNILFEHDYDIISEFHQGISEVSKGDKSRLIDQTGRPLTKLYNGVFLNYSSDYAVLRIFGKIWKHYIVDLKTKRILSAYECDYIEEFVDGIAPARANGKWGYIIMDQPPKLE